VIAAHIHGKIIPLSERVDRAIYEVVRAVELPIAKTHAATAEKHDRLNTARDELAEAIGAFAQEYAESYHQSKVRELPLSIELAKMATSALQAFTLQAEGGAVLEPKAPLFTVGPRRPAFRSD
jgi:hypothetical protein